MIERNGISGLLKSPSYVTRIQIKIFLELHYTVAVNNSIEWPKCLRMVTQAEVVFSCTTYSEFPKPSPDTWNCRRILEIVGWTLLSPGTAIFIISIIPRICWSVIVNRSQYSQTVVSLVHSEADICSMVPLFNQDEQFSRQYCTCWDSQ